MEFNCVLNGGHTTTFSVRSTIGWTWQKTIRSSMLSQCGQTLPYSREKGHRKGLSSEDLKWSQSARPNFRGFASTADSTLWRTGTSGGVGTAHNYLQIRWRCPENKDMFFQTETVTGASHEEREREVHRRLTRIYAHDEQEVAYSWRRRTNSETERVLYDHYSEWNRHVKDLDMLITDRLRTRFTSCTFVTKIFKEHGCPHERKENNYPP